MQLPKLPVPMPVPDVAGLQTCCAQYMPCGHLPGPQGTLQVPKLETLPLLVLMLTAIISSVTNPSMVLVPVQPPQFVTTGIVNLRVPLYGLALMQVMRFVNRL